MIKIVLKAAEVDSSLIRIWGNCYRHRLPDNVTPYT